MGEITNAFSSTFREFETDGVPSSGAHKVKKADAKALGALVENAIVSGRAPYATWAELDAVDGTDGEGAEVMASDTGTHTDPITSATVANAGIYRYVEGTPNGWKRVAGSSILGVATEDAAKAGTATDTAITPATLLAVDKVRAKYGKPIPLGGNLPGEFISAAGLYRGSYLFGVNPAAHNVATNDALVEMGIQYQATVNNGAQLYFGAQFGTVPRIWVRNGDWILAQVIVEKDPAASWSAFDSDWFTLANVPDSGPQQGFAWSTSGPSWVKVEDIDTHVRRYVIGGQFTTITDHLGFSILFVNNGTGAAIKVSGFACAVSRQRIYDIAWEQWDTGREGEFAARLDAIEVAEPAINHPDFLIPTDLFMVDGQELELFKAGLTPVRERTPYDFALCGARGSRGAVLWDDHRRLIADPARLDTGTGYMLAMATGRDTTTTYRKPISFHRANAARVFSPKVLAIGDSLTYRGWVTKLKAFLQAAGATPTFVGTFPDIAGTLCEGRSSWSTESYTGKSKAVNVNGSAPTYPIRTGAGAGVTFTYAQSGGVITSITASGGSGYTDTPALPVMISGAGSAVGARATVAISGGVPGAVTVLEGGTGYTGFVDIQLPPTVAEYLALGTAPADFGPRWTYNPFLRPATGGDAAGIIFNGYVFDVDFYLSRFSLPDPDIVFIALGTNDILRGYDTARIMTALKVMYAQTRAALPDAYVVFCINGLASLGNTGWDGVVALIREALKEFDERGAEKLFLLPTYALIDPKGVYDFTASSTNDYGVQTGGVGDAIHWANQGIGHAQWAAGAHAVTMNLP